MRRRTLLIGTAGLVGGLAGCIGDGPLSNTSSVSKAGTETQGGTRSPAGAAESKEFTAPEGGDETTVVEVEYEVATQPPGVEREYILYRPTTWWWAESFRYWDLEQEELAHLEPQRDWWVIYNLSVENLGGDPVSLPPADSYTLLAGGQSFQPRPELPIPFDQLRLQQGAIEFILRDIGTAYEDYELQGGESLPVTLLYDAVRDEGPRVRVDPHTGSQFVVGPVYGGSINP